MQLICLRHRSQAYEYEVEACARAIAQGEKECPEMPHDETVRVMEIMDGIRKSWGL